MEYCNSLIRPSVLIIDSNAIVRSALCKKISEQEDMILAGAAEGRQAAISVLRTSPAGIAVLDLSFTHDSGFSLVHDLRSLFPHVKLIVFTSLEEQIYAERCIRLGVRAFISKSEPLTTLVSAIMHVSRGGVCFSAELSHALFSRCKQDLDPVSLLSHSESVIFELLGRGFSIHEIAATLCRSVKTVETYRSRLKRRLGIDTSEGLTFCAMHHCSARLQMATLPS